MMAIAIGIRKKMREDVDPGLPALGKFARNNVDTHVLVFLQRVAGTEQENHTEQIPLDFDKGVGTVVDGVAHEGIAGTDQCNDQHQPDDRLADQFGQCIDQFRELE